MHLSRWVRFLHFDTGCEDKNFQLNLHTKYIHKRIMNRCTAMMMTVLGAAILSSCATATVATRGTGQRFQDGLYASSDDSQTKEDRQESERINDILIEKTKASEIYLFSETSKDTVVIPQNMAATIKFNGNDGTSVTVAQAPDWLQEDAWRYDWMYGPYFYRPYGYWYGSYYGGWRYDPWYGYYDPWYGGYYSHWYAFHSPWYGCYDPWFGCYDPWYGYYDPWFGHHHHHHIFIEPMPDMGRKVVYASRNQTGTRGMSAGKLEGTVRTAVRSGANFTSSSTRTTPARERVVSKSRTDRTSTGDRLTPSSTSGYRRAGQTASSSSSASYRRPAASTDRSSSSTSGYSRSSSSSTSGYSRGSSSSTSGYSRSSSSSNSGYSRSSSSSNSGYSRSSSSSSSSYSRSSSSSNSGYSRSSSSSNSGYSRSSSSSSSSYSRGSSSSGYSGGASRGGGYSGGSRR